MKNETNINRELLEALMNLHTQVWAHHKMNVKKDYSLMVAAAAADKAIHAALEAAKE